VTDPVELAERLVVDLEGARQDRRAHERRTGSACSRAESRLRPRRRRIRLTVPSSRIPQYGLLRSEGRLAR
jgi:hypothetical protein